MGVINQLITGGHHIVLFNMLNGETCDNFRHWMVMTAMLSFGEPKNGDTNLVPFDHGDVVAVSGSAGCPSDVNVDIQLNGHATGTDLL